MRHNAFLFIHTCHVTRSHRQTCVGLYAIDSKIWHDAFIYATRRILIHSYMWRDSFAQANTRGTLHCIASARHKATTGIYPQKSHTYPQKSLSFPQRSHINPPKSHVYLQKKPCISAWDFTLHCLRSTQGDDRHQFLKALFIFAKELYVLVKKSYLYTQGPFIPTKEPHIPAKETYVSV